MKTILSFFLSVFLLISAGAQTTDYVTSKDFQNEKKKLNEGIISAKKAGLEAKKSLEKQEEAIDGLNNAFAMLKAQLEASNDSINKLNSAVAGLSDRIAQRKTNLTTGLVLSFACIILFLVILLTWMIVVQKRSREKINALKADIEKVNDKIDSGMNKIGEEIKSLSGELSSKLKAGLAEMENKTGQFIQQAQDRINAIDSKISAAVEELGLKIKGEGDRISGLQSLIDQKNQETSGIIVAIEKSMKAIEPAVNEKVSALKTQLEQKIQSISAEISKPGK